jgi:hypothetical protein
LLKGNNKRINWLGDRRRGWVRNGFQGHLRWDNYLDISNDGKVLFSDQRGTIPKNSEIEMEEAYGFRA